jgi:quercetin dioxygenase-like cupin family protein
MFNIDKTISTTTYKGLLVQNIFKSESAETLLISLEKDHVFPEHTSPRDALLVLLEGRINFTIQEREYVLNCSDSFTFPANEQHRVQAQENSKFLIIR